MRQLCYHPAPICPSTDSILQLDISPSTQTSGRKKRRGGKEAEVGRQTKQRQRRQAEAALARLTGRKWRQSELGHEWDEIQGGGAGALRGTTLWTEAAPPGRRADCLWIQRASTAEGWEGTTFALVAGDVWARPTGVHLQHVQCYTTPDALQGRSELPPSPSSLSATTSGTSSTLAPLGNDEWFQTFWRYTLVCLIGRF